MNASLSTIWVRWSSMFYLDFFSVGSLIALALSISFSLYLLTLRGKSSATKHLGLAFLWVGVLNLGYFVATSFYVSEVAYHRWLTVTGGLFLGIHLTQFFLHYPTNFRPRIALAILIAQSTLAILVTVNFMRASLQADYVFHFDGHYWDVDADAATRVVAALLMVQAFIFVGAGLGRAVVLRGRERWTSLAIAITLFLSGFVQTVTNSLSRQGTIDRGVFQTVYVLTVVLGFFFVIVIYINNTRDRTSFMAKIIAISLVTLLLMLQGVGYYTIADRESAYDELRRYQTELALARDFRPADLEYLIAYLADGRVIPVYTSDRLSRLSLDWQSFGAAHARGAATPAQQQARLPSGARQYRYLSGRHIVAFEQADPFRSSGASRTSRPDDVLAYEAGYDYIAYRGYVHEAAWRLSLMLAAILFVALVLFRFFFQGALVTPLLALLRGVRKVNSGELDARIPVKVEDEIGYITRSFNGMVDSIREAQQQLQDHAGRLEENVRERTAKLQETLTRVQELKQEQDGDYFLTSLLIRPLSTNRARGRNVAVDFLLRQKKSFQFRKWADEIGGDICIAHSVKLRGSEYTVFLNADAMGKSMQGAGGALVLGAVFEALIERTILAEESRSRHPERWLKDAFVELHRVFEVFEGSMLVSLVLALIEDETGVMYYINAEHPWSVLYRDGVARFIEDNLSFRKLGTLGIEGRIHIKTIQLEAGDVVICGSDGRDDLRIIDASGESRIAEDETAFLRRVEEGDGQLQRVFNAVVAQGELTDDLSLLRVAFQEDHAREASVPVRSEHNESLYRKGRAAMRAGDFAGAIALLAEAHGDNGSDSHILRLLATACYKHRDYARAAGYAVAYAELRPADTELLFLAGYCYRRIGRLDLAADFGERVRLRQPGDVRNLLLLADIYTHQSDPVRAWTLLEHALAVEPENQKALNLQRAVHKQMTAIT